MAYSDVNEAVVVFEAVMIAGSIAASLALACALLKKKDHSSKTGLVLSLFGALPATWYIFTEHESLSLSQLDSYDILFLMALPTSIIAFGLSARTDNTKNKN